MGIPENTHKYLQKTRKEVLAETKDIEEEMSVTDPHSQTFEELRSKKLDLHNEVVRLNQLLNAPIAKIVDQSTFCLLGNAVLISINGKKKKYFINSTCIGKSVSISVECQLVREILGKKVGDKGSYRCQNTGKMIYWEILAIEPYSIAKGIFKNQNQQQLA